MLEVTTDTVQTRCTYEVAFGGILCDQWRDAPCHIDPYTLIPFRDGSGNVVPPYEDFNHHLFKPGRLYDVLAEMQSEIASLRDRVRYLEDRVEQ